jgi:hypothetical protein
MISLEKLIDGSVTARNFDKLSRAVNHPTPQARVYNSGPPTISHNTTTALTFNSERFDHGDLHSTSSNTSRLTAPVAGLYSAAPVAGLYSVGANFRFAANATGQRYGALRVNGSTVIAEDMVLPGSAAVLPRLVLSTIWRLAAGDYVEVLAFQTSGGALDVETSSATSPEFWMVRLAGYENVGLE